MAEELTMPDLGSDLFTLLKDGNNHDLAVVCEGGERVQVHRLILGARSVVFQRMVEVDMRERNTGTIEIKNFGAGVVKELINYIYSDQITSDFTDLTELMKLAHQYEVYGLVKQCSDRLVQEVSVDNVVMLSTLAETLGVEKLFGKCAKVVAENYEHLDPKTLDSLPSSLFRKSLDVRAKISVVTSSSGESEDQNGHYMANFYTNHIYPMVTKEKSSLCTEFTVNRATKLTGIGLYINGNQQISMDLSVSSYSNGNLSHILGMTDKVTATDCTKPLKIVFPALVKCDINHRYRVQIVVGTECVNFKGNWSKSPLSLPMKSGELVVEIKHTSVQIPVFYFEDK